MRSDSSNSTTVASAGSSQPRGRDGLPVVFVTVGIVAAVRFALSFAVDESSLQPSWAVFSVGGRRALTDAAEDAPAVLVATAASCVPRVLDIDVPSGVRVDTSDLV